MAKKKMVEDCATHAFFQCRTWGDLESLAGILDRKALWRGRTEKQVYEFLADKILGTSTHFRRVSKEKHETTQD